MATMNTTMMRFTNSFLFVAVFCCCSAPVRAQLPNIVVIYADDMGYGDLAIQNPESKIPTPHLDQLAMEGMRFTDGHSSSGICTPSRYALLTGRYHWRKFHSIVRPWEDSVFAPERLTLPEMLKAKGYHTACIGKWHLGFDWSAIRKPDAKMVGEGKQQTWSAEAFDWSKSIPGGPLDHGFDYYFGDDVPNFPPYAWIENDRVVDPPTVPYRPDPVPAEGAAEGRPGPMVAGWKQDQVMPTLTQRTVNWLQQQNDEAQPFFLYWSWTSPHAPIVPTHDWQGKSSAGDYGDFLAQSDHHAGQVLKALDESGLAENTIVIFSSDNGPERYAFERLRNYEHNSSGPLRGVKRDVWEGGHRVPFIVRWPGVVKAGAVSDGLISQIDLMATLASIVGAQLPPGSADDSHNQLPHWKGGDSPRQSIVHNTFSNCFAIRSDDWVMIDQPTGSAKEVPDWYTQQMGYDTNPHPMALFNLNEDPGQLVNQFQHQPKRVAELEALLEKIRSEGEIRRLPSGQANGQADPPIPKLLVTVQTRKKFEMIGVSESQIKELDELISKHRLSVHQLRRQVGINEDAIRLRDKGVREARSLGLSGDAIWNHVQKVGELTAAQRDAFKETLEQHNAFREAALAVLTAEQREKFKKAKIKKNRQKEETAK